MRFVLALWGISDVAVTVAKMEFRCQAIRLQLTLSKAIILDCSKRRGRESEARQRREGAEREREGGGE